MKTEFDVQLTEKDLYSFNIHQIYRGSQGFVSIILTIIVWVIGGMSIQQGDVSRGVLYIAGGIFVLVYIPLTLKARVKRTMKNNAVLSGVLHYEITEDSVKCISGDESGDLPWDMIYKFVANDKWVLIYSNRVNAYIIPKNQIENEYSTLVEIAKSQLESYRLKVK